MDDSVKGILDSVMESCLTIYPCPPLWSVLRRACHIDSSHNIFFSFVSFQYFPGDSLCKILRCTILRIFSGHSAGIGALNVVCGE